jgi:hypothetical protein
MAGLMRYSLLMLKHNECLKILISGLLTLSVIFLIASELF